MSSWTPADLTALAADGDLYISPLRQDGRTYARPTQIWWVDVDGEMFVRAWHGPTARWYRTALAQGRGRVRVGSLTTDATFRAAPTENADAVDAAYRAKYGSSSYTAAMLADGPKAATVIVTPVAPR